MNFKPMLCAREKINDLTTLPYPLMCTPKYDGMRCIITDRGPRTKQLKRIANLYAHDLLAKLPVGLDGELAIIRDGKVDFRGTGSAIRNRKGNPQFLYFVFDYMSVQNFTYPRRMFELRTMKEKYPEHFPEWVIIVQNEHIGNWQRMADYYVKCRMEGFEGTIMRRPSSPYKHGRSTLNEGYLLRIKPRDDGEATIVQVLEEMENTNEAEIDRLGLQKRSSHQDGMVGKGRAGSLLCKSPMWRMTFKIGSGFDTKDRIAIWKNREQLKGQTILFDFDPNGGYKERPRQAVFRDFVDFVLHPEPASKS